MSNTEAIRTSRLNQIVELFKFLELNNDEKLLYIMKYCSDECVLCKARCNELKNLLDFLNNEKRKLFSRLREAAVSAGCVQKSNRSLMDTWQIDELLMSNWGRTLKNAKRSHILKLIHLFETGGVLP
jgi:hypothetical protein